MEALAFPALALLLFLGSGSIKITSGGRSRLVERLGKYDREMQPGLSFVLPVVEKVVSYESLKERVLDIPPQQCITRDTIWRPCFRGQPGHPVLFGRDFWPALAGIDGESGAASLIRQHASHYRTHDVDDAGVVFDVDTPDTLSSLKDAL